MGRPPERKRSACLHHISLHRQSAPSPRRRDKRNRTIWFIEAGHRAHDLSLRHKSSHAVASASSLIGRSRKTSCFASSTRHTFGSHHSCKSDIRGARAHATPAHAIFAHDSERVAGAVGVSCRTARPPCCPIAVSPQFGPKPAKRAIVCAIAIYCQRVRYGGSAKPA